MSTDHQTGREQALTAALNEIKERLKRGERLMCGNITFSLENTVIPAAEEMCEWPSVLIHLFTANADAEQKAALYAFKALMNQVIDEAAQTHASTYLDFLTYKHTQEKNTQAQYQHVWETL